MAQIHFIAHRLDYGRELVHAGMDGIREGERLVAHSPQVHFSSSARQSLKTAILGGTVALVACKVIHGRKFSLAPVFACGTAAFCADFFWRTRDVRSRIVECAEREISRVRDRHWLDSHPIDYA